jgi:hypothetical protein
MAEYQTPRGPVRGNPLFDAWTQVLAEDLLTTKGQTGFGSLLNARAIEKTAEEAVGKTGTRGPDRPFLTNPLRVFATVTNLTSLPYSIMMGGGTGVAHTMSTMADWSDLLADVATGAEDKLRKDKFAADSSARLDRSRPDGWKDALSAALSTCAFPGAFPARQIKRSAVSPCYRFIATSDDQGKAAMSQLVPDWNLLVPDYTPNLAITSLNVDGGACNNEPIDIARRVLAGFEGRNPREGKKAHRATILIDPLTSSDGLGPVDPPTDPISPLVRLIGGLISQARFKPEDLALAQDENVYSRFLIAPVGQGYTGHTETSQPTVGGLAIASGAFGGFSGFLKRAFLEYDFNLGRMNAYRFLTKHFFLPADNPLFAGRWPGGQSPGSWEYTDKATKTLYRAIIPVMSSVPAPLDPGKLPTITSEEIDDIMKVGSERVEWLFDQAKDALLKSKTFGNFIARGYLNLGWMFKRSALKRGIREYLEKGLRERGLMA